MKKAGSKELSLAEKRLKAAEKELRLQSGRYEDAVVMSVTALDDVTDLLESIANLPEDKTDRLMMISNGRMRIVEKEISKARRRNAARTIADSIPARGVMFAGRKAAAFGISAAGAVCHAIMRTNKKKGAAGKTVRTLKSISDDEAKAEEKAFRLKMKTDAIVTSCKSLNKAVSKSKRLEGKNYSSRKLFFRRRVESLLKMAEHLEELMK